MPRRLERRNSLYKLAERRHSIGDSDIGSDDDYSCRSLYGSMHCTAELAGHQGCVNALDWRADGTILASASDDCKVCLWSYPEGRLMATLPTEHKANIFSVRWIGDSHHLVTASGDRSIGRLHLRPDGSLASHDRCICPRDRVKKIDCEPLNPFIYFAACEDGKVYADDLRQPHDCEHHTEDTSPLPSCLAMREATRDIPLLSLSINPLDPNYIALSGECGVVMIADRRYCVTYPQLWIPPTAAVNAHATTNSSNTSLRLGSVENITCVKFNRFSGHLLASTLNDRVFRLDFGAMCSGHYANRSPILRKDALDIQEAESLFHQAKYASAAKVFHQLYQRHLLSLHHRTLLGMRVIFLLLYNMMVSCIRRSAWEDLLDAGVLLDRHIWDWEEREKSLSSLDEPIQRLAHLEALYRGGYVGATRCDGLEQQMRQEHGELIPILQHPSWLQLSQQTTICYNAAQSYFGHRNKETIKDCSFVGVHDELVASGSDGGYFFIWDAHSAITAFVGCSDEAIVNGVVQHPKLPVVAVHGIDSSIKLWEPAGEILSPEEEQRLLDERGIDRRWMAMRGIDRAKLIEKLATGDESYVPGGGIGCRSQ